MLALIPLLPFAGFLVNALVGKRLPKPISGSLATGVMAVSFVIAVMQVLALAGMPPEALAYTAYPLDAPARGRQWQADRPLQPASTMKVLTTAVALDALGPNWRGRTELLAAGALIDGVLDGPLVLRGGADADLDWGALWNLLRQARESGIREVRGGLRVDRSRFSPAREDQVPPFDEAPEFPYNVIPDALHLNGNLLDLHLTADAAQLTARVSPAWPGLRVDASAMALVDAPCATWEDHWKLPQVSQDAQGTVVRLQGGFPRTCQVKQALNLVDRDQIDPLALLHLWRQLGGEAPHSGLGAAPDGARTVALHLARPLGELVRGVMKRSDNALTRLIYLQLGVNPGVNPGATPDAQPTRAVAEARVRAWLKARGIDDTALVLDNGSGLSRSERLSPTLLAQVLATAAQGRNAPELLASLPVAGVDGTLSRRFKGGPAEGRARLKTGTLSNAVGLAGFVPDARNRLWVVVALLNHPDASTKGRPVLDALIDHLAR